MQRKRESLSLIELSIFLCILFLLQVGGVYSYDCSFGHVPNVELMKFIAMATFGTYLSTCPEVEPSSLDINVYHKAFLPYSFLRSGESLNPEYYCGKLIFHGLRCSFSILSILFTLSSPVPRILGQIELSD